MLCAIVERRKMVLKTNTNNIIQMKETKTADDLGLSLHENRLLIFLETDPQSGKFQQLLLNAKQFKRISDAIFQDTRIEMSDLKEGHEVAELEVSDETYNLPDLESIN